MGLFLYVKKNFALLIAFSFKLSWQFILLALLYFFVRIDPRQQIAHNVHSVIETFRGSKFQIIYASLWIFFKEILVRVKKYGTL